MSAWPLRLMIYGAGEAVDGSGALAPAIAVQLANLARVVTNRSVAAIAQLDASDVPTQRYVLDPRGQQPVYQISNVDVGDPAQLTAFVGWAAAICPASRSVLVLSGHGAAWEDGMVAQALGTNFRRGVTAVPSVPGALHHPRSLFGTATSPSTTMTKMVLIDGHNRDFLSNAELGVACDNIRSQLGGKIDVLVFDACLMSAWEILAELSGSVSTVVASIDELSAAGVDLSGPAAQFTAAGGTGSPAAMAAQIAGTFTPLASFDSCVAVDLGKSSWMSAILAFRDFCAGVHPWVAAGNANAAALIGALRVASSSVVQYNGGGLADAKVFADTVAAIPGLPAAASNALRTAAAALGDCVVARSAGRDYQAALGVSIFSPGSATVHGSNRAEYNRLLFANQTGWGAVLDTIYGFANDATRLLAPVPAAQSTAGADDSEFIVALQGIPIEADVRERIDKAIQRTVLLKLAELDLLGNVTVTPVAGPVRFALPGDPVGEAGLDAAGGIAGFVVKSIASLVTERH